MSTGYYCEDHPNPNFTQYGWPRTRVSGVIGVHTTESGVVPAGADPGAENTAGFIGRRTDPGSYHVLADWDTRIKLVRPRYAAWADITNNAHAMSVSGAMNAARWRDLSPERAAGIVRNMGIAAAELVLDAIADGLLDAPPPARRITAAEAIAGTEAGFYGHGETNPGTRYDPGTNFDWDLFLSTYAAAVGGGIQLQSTSISEEDDDLTPDQFNQLVGKLDELNAAHHVATREHVNGATKRILDREPLVIDRLDVLNTAHHVATREHVNGVRDGLLANFRATIDLLKPTADAGAVEAAEKIYQEVAERLGNLKITVTTGGE